jgi:hypothetical protein
MQAEIRRRIHMTISEKKPSSFLSSSSLMMRSVPVIFLIVAAILFAAAAPPLPLAMAQQTTTTTTSPPSSPLPLSPPPLTPQEQQEQTRLQNTIAATTQNLAQGQKEIGGVVFTPRWSEPVWVEPGESSTLFAYCLPGEFAYSLVPGEFADAAGQGILGGPELSILESYAVAVTANITGWYMVVENEDANVRHPAAAGVICASDLNDAEARILSPQEQQQVNNAIQQFNTVQNGQGTTTMTNIDQVTNRINNVTNQNTTGGGGGTTALPAMPSTASRDTTAPTLSVPNDMVLQTAGPTALLVYSVTAQDDRDGTATLDEDNQLIQGDNLGGNITISCRPSSQYFLSPGNRTVECLATDTAGNEGTASFIVSVRGPASIPGSTNTASPTLTVPDTIVVTTAAGSPGHAVEYTVTAQDNVDGTATLDRNNMLTQDNVGGSITISCNPASVHVFPVGNHTVLCSAANAAGNTAEASFIVAVKGTTTTPAPPGPPASTDTTAPVIEIPENIRVGGNNNPAARIEVPYAVTASDNVDGTALLNVENVNHQDDVGGDIIIVCHPASRLIVPVGITTVECTAIDEAGNRARASFTVTLELGPLTTPPGGPQTLQETLREGALVEGGAPLAGGGGPMTATLSANPATYNGPCPVVIQFSGTITDNVGNRDVRYQVIYSDGNTGPERVIHFNQPGSQSISEAREFGDTNTSPSMQGWAVIKILYPLQAQSESNRAEFKITCTPPLAETETLQEGGAQLLEVPPDGDQSAQTLEGGEGDTTTEGGAAEGGDTTTEGGGEGGDTTTEGGGEGGDQSPPPVATDEGGAAEGGEGGDQSPPPAEGEGGG